MNCLDDMDICQTVDFVRGQWEAPREEVLGHSRQPKICLFSF